MPWPLHRIIWVHWLERRPRSQYRHSNLNMVWREGVSASRCRNCRRFRPGEGIRGNAPESPSVLQRTTTKITMWIYLNNRFVKEEEAVVSVFDHGFLYGDGVYETIRSYGSRIFMRDLHLARLYRSADAIGLTIPISEHRWPLLLHEAMTRNDVGHEHTDSYLR